MTPALLFAAALTLDPAAPAPPASVPAPAVSTTPQDPLAPDPIVRPFEMPAAPPAAPIPYAENADPKAPVKVEDYHRSYEGPEDAQETAYDAGVKGAYQAEQALHGGLDGLWAVTGADGRPIMTLAISDPGEGRGPLAGAWRDLSRSKDPMASGLIDEAVRDGRALVVRIRLHDDAPVTTLKLTPAPDGRWTGQLLDGGAGRPVVMDRTAL